MIKATPYSMPEASKTADQPSSTPSENPTSVMIVEEQLVGLSGHHFGQLADLTKNARQCGVVPSVLCGRTAPPEVSSELDARPVLDGLSPGSTVPLFRGRSGALCAVLLGILRNALTLIHQLGQQPRATLLLLPTAWIPHIAMLILVAAVSRSRISGVRVQFLSRWDPTRLRSRVDLRIVRFLLLILNRLHHDVRIYGQTPLVCADIRGNSSLNVEWLPEPSHSVRSDLGTALGCPAETTVFGSYGFARHEQGTDLLQSAIRILHERDPSFDASFRIVWPCGNFNAPDGSVISPDLRLQESGKVNFFQNILKKNEILELLESTDWIVLPYRMSDYRRRSSLLAVDAICRGIPAIYTSGTFLEELFTRFGAGIPVSDSNAYELAIAIERAKRESPMFKAEAKSRADSARRFFSVKEFWQRVL